MSTAPVCDCVSVQCSTLYAECLRRHRWNEDSLCALVLHLCMCRLLRGSAARCRWAQRKGGRDAGLGGERRRSCLANCRRWWLAKRRRRHCRHGNLTEKSLRSGCCLAAAATEVICVWRVTSIVQHLNLEQAVVGGRRGYGGNKQCKDGGLFEEGQVFWPLTWGMI